MWLQSSGIETCGGAGAGAFVIMGPRVALSGLQCVTEGNAPPSLWFPIRPSGEFPILLITHTDSNLIAISS